MEGYLKVAKNGLRTSLFHINIHQSRKADIDFSTCHVGEVVEKVAFVLMLSIKLIQFIQSVLTFRWMSSLLLPLSSSGQPQTFFSCCSYQFWSTPLMTPRNMALTFLTTSAGPHITLGNGPVRPLHGAIFVVLQSKGCRLVL